MIRLNQRFLIIPKILKFHLNQMFLMIRLNQRFLIIPKILKFHLNQMFLMIRLNQRFLIIPKILKFPMSRRPLRFHSIQTIRKNRRFRLFQKTQMSRILHHRFPL
jgi:hypothetical protein